MTSILEDSFQMLHATISISWFYRVLLPASLLTTRTDGEIYSPPPRQNSWKSFRNFKWFLADLLQSANSSSTIRQNSWLEELMEDETPQVAISKRSDQHWRRELSRAYLTCPLRSHLKSPHGAHQRQKMIVRVWINSLSNRKTVSWCRLAKRNPPISQ